MTWNRACMRILFFAHLREATGQAAVVWADAAPGTVPELWDRLLREFPGLASHRAGVRLARNRVYANADELLAPDDEIALIPPVSGG